MQSWPLRQLRRNTPTDRSHSSFHGPLEAVPISRHACWVCWHSNGVRRSGQYCQPHRRQWSGRTFRDRFRTTGRLHDWDGYWEISYFKTTGSLYITPETYDIIFTGSDVSSWDYSEAELAAQNRERFPVSPEEQPEKYLHCIGRRNWRLVAHCNRGTWKGRRRGCGPCALGAQPGRRTRAAGGDGRRNQHLLRFSWKRSRWPMAVACVSSR